MRTTMLMTTRRITREMTMKRVVTMMRQETMRETMRVITRMTTMKSMRVTMRTKKVREEMRITMITIMMTKSLRPRKVRVVQVIMWRFLRTLSPTMRITMMRKDRRHRSLVIIIITIIVTIIIVATVHVLVLPMIKCCREAWTTRSWRSLWT